ncbi:hypothetical protein SNE40_001320 [Patella caerulea]|uniref:FZ domain-containing protein n=1 Tax=Patella caerulea TaxID=87958 RepID=A0AAN8QB14_PATCE
MTSFNVKWVIIASVISISLVAVSGQACVRVEVPMCKGLINYNFTRLPNKFGHTTQSEVYWALQQWWPFMDMGCSQNLRLLICGLYLPKCTTGSTQVQLPCRETCRRAKNRCSQEMQRQNLPWSSQFRCSQFLPKRSRRCVGPLKEKKKKKSRRRHVTCQRNHLPMCSGIGYRFGSLPNMFLQSNIREMKREMAQYQPLLDTNCSPHLKFFLCGVFMPFCLKQETSECEVPFVVPCREVCESVQTSCGQIFERQRGGLPWPGKFHCHRYPSRDYTRNPNDCSVSCVMPN